MEGLQNFKQGWIHPDPCGVCVCGGGSGCHGSYMWSENFRHSASMRKVKPKVAGFDVQNL